MSALYVVTPKGDVVLVLTPLEVAGLATLAAEGAEGLFTDRAALAAYVGGRAAVDAARRALDRVRVAHGDLLARGALR